LQFLVFQVRGQRLHRVVEFRDGLGLFGGGSRDVGDALGDLRRAVGESLDLALEVLNLR